MHILNLKTMVSNKDVYYFSFKTFPQKFQFKTFKFGMASCAKTSSDSKIFTKIFEQDLDFFI